MTKSLAQLVFTFLTGLQGLPLSIMLCLLHHAFLCLKPSSLSHGFSFNVSTDLKYFSAINPCGITDRGVTSLQQELGGEVVSLAHVQEEALKSFSTVFNCEMRPL